MPWLHALVCILPTLCVFLQVAPVPGGDKLAEPIRLGRPVKDTPVPSLQRTSIVFSPDGKNVAWMHCIPEVAPNDRGGLMIDLWDVDKKLALVEMKAINDFTYASSPLRFMPNGRMLAAGCFQMNTEVEELSKPGTQIGCNVRVWLVLSGRELPIIQKQSGPIQDRWQALAVSPDGRTMSAVSGTGGQVWKLPEGKSLAKFSLGPAVHLVMARGGKLAAGMVGDRSVRVWKTEEGAEAGKEVAKLPGPSRPLGFGPEGKQLAVIHDDRIALCDVQTGKELWAVPEKLAEDEVAGQHFDFAPDGKRLAWNHGGKITVVDAATGKTVHSISAQPGPLAFSPDGRRLALACPDGTALVWQLEK